MGNGPEPARKPPPKRRFWGLLNKVLYTPRPSYTQKLEVPQNLER
jgi:hypothetical protein